MIVSYSGDPFLARRAAKRFLARQGLPSQGVAELGEGLTAEVIAFQASQAGLFGPSALLLDFAEAFTGPAGVKPRNEAMAALKDVGEEAVVVVIDPDATPARKKSWRALGEHTELPTPRYEALPRWVKTELDAAGVRYAPSVPAALADIFGEEPATIVSEISKLSVLDEEFDVDRVRELANRPASRDAFDMIDAIAAGDPPRALAITRELLAAGEAPQRVFGALVWQFMLVGKAVAVAARHAPRRVGSQQAAAALKAKPFVVQKAMKLAESLDEREVELALEELLAADVRAKTGGDPEWALESVVLRLAALWAKTPAR